MKAETKSEVQRNVDEVFCGNDLQDQFLALLNKTPRMLSAEERTLCEAFFFAGAGNVFKLLDRAHDIVEAYPDAPLEDRAAAYGSVFDRLQEEIQSRSVEGLISAITRLLKEASK